MCVCVCVCVCKCRCVCVYVHVCCKSIMNFVFSIFQSRLVLDKKKTKPGYVW